MGRSKKHQTDRCCMKTQLESSFIFDRWIPSWGQVNVTRAIGDASSSRVQYLATVRWLLKTRNAHLEEMPTSGDKDGQAYRQSLRTFRRIAHPNVQSFWGVCRLDSTLFAVTPRTPLNFKQFMKADTTMDRRPFVAQIVNGLHYIHKLNIVHGNVDLDNIFMSPQSRPVLTGFFCNMYPQERPKVESLSGWAVIEDPPLVIPQDTDAPYEFIPKYPDALARIPIFVRDTDVGDGVAFEVDALLKSFDVATDIFSLGFLIMEIFSELNPRTSRCALQILRMVLKHQKPPHPGRRALLRGLDERHWETCLACWATGDEEDMSLGRIISKLSLPVGVNWIQPPFDWPILTVESIARSRVSPLLDSVRDKHDVRDGRDAEAGLYEVKGLWEVQPGRTLPVKIISPTLCRRGSLRRPPDFMAEVFVWSQLTHKNILPLLGTTQFELTDCFVTPWMEGGSCVDYFRAHPDTDPFDILVQIADVLHYLHTREPPMVHGYLRARSVLMSSEGVPYLSNFDFQPLQYPDRDFDDSVIDDAGRWSGPELVTSKETTKSDVFAFGMFAYELYSRQVPYAHIRDRQSPVGGKLDVWTTKELGIRPERPDSQILSDEVWALIERCWAHNPALRPSAGTVYQDLQAIKQRRVVTTR